MTTTRSADHPTAPLPAYAEWADRYDRDTAVHDRWRRQLVDALPLRPGDTVLDAAGGKWPPPWQLPLSLYVRSLHASYIRDFAGFDRPWRLLERRLDGFCVTEVALGSGYLVTGWVPAAG